MNNDTLARNSGVTTPMAPGNSRGDEREAEPTPLAQQLQDPAFLALLQNMMRTTIAEAANQPPVQPLGGNGPVPPVADSAGRLARLKSEEIGYFDPTAEGEGDIVSTGKHVVYKDVYEFTELIETCAQQWSDAEVRPLIAGCLRGDAIKWHSNELSSDKRTLLARAVSCDEWTQALIKRFKMKTSTSLVLLHETKYGVADARKGVLARQHANKILKFTKSAEIESIKNRINYIYMSFAYEFKQDLRAPTDTTTIEEYLDGLDERQETWDERAQRGYRRPSPPPKPSRLQGRPQPSFKQRDWVPQETTYQFKTPYYRSNAPRSQQTTQPTQQRYALPAPKAPLQITDGRAAPPFPASQQRPFYPQQRPPQSYPSGRYPQNRGGSYPPRQDSRGVYPNLSYANRSPQQQSGQQRSATAYQGDANKEGSPPGEEPPAEEDQHAQGQYADEPDSYDYEYDYEEELPQQYFATSVPQPEPFECRVCGESFTSNNRLHAHLGNRGLGRGSHTRTCPGRSMVHAMKKQEESKTEDFQINIQSESSPSPNLGEAQFNETPEEEDVQIIGSNADSSMEVGSGHAYRSWRYAQLDVQLDPSKGKDTHTVCADSGTSMTMMDRKLKEKDLPQAHVHTMAFPARVRGIGNDVHETSEYIIQEIFFPRGKDKEGRPATARTALREIHLVDGLAAGMLIGNDVLVPEGIDLLFSKRVASIGSCGVEVPIEVRSKGPLMKRTINSKKTVVVPPNSSAVVPIYHLDLPDRDFMFEPIEDSTLALYAGLIDQSTRGILVKNAMDKPVHIRRNTRLGHLAELSTDGCYHITEGQEDVAELATRHPKEEHRQSFAKGFFKKLLKAGKATAVAMLAAGIGTATSSQPSPELTPSVKTATLTPNLEVVTTTLDTVLPNGVTVHGNVPELAQVVTEFPSVWNEEGFVDVPETEWMRIPLRSDWETKSSKTARVYPLGADARKVIDDTFDKLHDQGRMSWTSESTPFSYPVFVVWTVRPDGSRKGRAVVDIRGLNAITQTDVYPLPLQADMISAVKGCIYITVVNCASFFYQWRTHPEDRYRTTVVTHRGQETFNVAVMGYKNSPAYVQRQIDRLLRPHRQYARAYIDDVVIHSATLEDHVKHLRAVLGLFAKFNVSVNPKKAFIGYPSVKLLGQKVNSFGLATDEEKLKAIASLKFPYTLNALEHYLGFTGWLRQFISHYAFITKPLLDRKTELLAKAPRSGQQRQDYSKRTRIENPTDKEIASFHATQQALARTTLLVHFDNGLVLFIDVDTSKAGGIGAMVYHVDGKIPDPKNYPDRKKVRPILFLSRVLKGAETRYWPTELELAGIVWVLTKVRHMVDTAPKTIIYTDHGAALGIAKQTTLTTSSTDKMNLRLVRASDYIQRFKNIEFRYKMGAKHIIPDALSRLPHNGPHEIDEAEGQLDTLWVHAYATTALVEMAPEFKERILQGYQDDPAWLRILDTLKANDDADEDAAKLPFYLSNDGLIWRIDNYTSDHAFAPERLYVPDSCVKDFFDIAHDKNGHIGRDKCHEIIARQWYIRGLGRQLREYLRHCQQCQLYQTQRHQPYGALQPILTPPTPYHTISMDFILALPVTVEGFDCCLTVTDKFSRKIALIPGEGTWSAERWADDLLTTLMLLDWGLPKAIVSDRDRKFISAMWNQIFKRLGVNLLYSTAYHPQTDGSSERTNQTVEIALRFWIATLRQPAEWPKTLPIIQFRCNNALSTSIRRTPTEVATGFTLNDSLELLGREPKPIDPKIARLEAYDAVAWAQMNQKFHYDRAHHPQFLRKGDFALLRLHKGYDIPATKTIGKKLSQQYVGPFRVLERIGRLAYRLEVPDDWVLHPVFTIAQLEPCPDPATDPYGRERPTHPGPVSTERDDIPNDEWEVTRVIDKRVTGRGKTQYLMRWQGHEAHYDRWRNEEDIFAEELIKEYEEHRGTIPERPTRRQRAARRDAAQDRSPEAPARRKRGRPRKNPVAPSQGPPATSHEARDPPPVRRGPGRPRKQANGPNQ